MLVNAYLLYFVTAGLNYVFLFDKKLRLHPKFIPGQEWKEISVAVREGGRRWKREREREREMDRYRV